VEARPSLDGIKFLFRQVGNKVKQRVDGGQGRTHGFRVGLATDVGRRQVTQPLAGVVSVRLKELDILRFCLVFWQGNLADSNFRRIHCFLLPTRAEIEFTASRH